MCFVVIAKFKSDIAWYIFDSVRCLWLCMVAKAACVFVMIITLP